MYGLREILLVAAVVALAGGVLGLLLIRGKDFVGAPRTAPAVAAERPHRPARREPASDPRAGPKARGRTRRDPGGRARPRRRSQARPARR